MINEKNLLNKKFIAFVDIDETIFKTFAKVHVVKEEKLVKKLTNKEFNHYELKIGERFDFCEFVDGKLFKETSIPINNVVEQLKKITKKIKKEKNGSRIIFLTARSDFLDKEEFLESFRMQGLEIDNKDLMYIERAGNLEQGSIPEKKKKVIQKYLTQNKYDYCQLIDDDEKNINVLKEIAQEKNKTKKESRTTFQGFLVDGEGKTSLIYEETT